MFESEKITTEEIVNEYKDEVTELIKFLPWLEKKKGNSVISAYTPKGNVEGHSMVIPTYDSNLLSFVKALNNSPHMNKNYAYVYRHNSINNVEDEMRVISRARIQDIELIYGILSHYIISGRVRGAIWNEGVENGIYYTCVMKLKELIETWDKPLNGQSAMPSQDTELKEASEDSQPEEKAEEE